MVISHKQSTQSADSGHNISGTVSCRERKDKEAKSANGSITSPNGQEKAWWT